MTPQWLKDFVARLTRKRILRGRAGAGVYSLESWRAAPDEPQRSDNARRAGHYGFVSEAPNDGTVEVVSVAINGGTTNPAAVAETVVGEPVIEDREVLLWSLHGQRVLLDENSRVSVDNGDGGTVIVDGDKTTISQDVTVSRDLTVGRDGRVNRDLVVNHLIGDGDITHGAIPNAPVIASADAVGDDVSFDLTFSVAAMQTLASGAVVATVGLARSYGSEPRCVASPRGGSFPGPASFGAVAAAPGVIEIRFYGQAIPGAVTGLSCTVFVLGKS